jgi:4-hydroxy-3-polyprenylbenzoate decarboxylase
MKKIVIGITGASGTIYALDLLQNLANNSEVETHLVMSKWAKENLALESTGYQLADVKAIADFVYDERDMGARIASGSFQHDGMVVVPASMKSIASIATGLGDTLIGRAADVTLKERRPLIVVPRESPFNQIHLENMLKLSRMGVDIIPPIPAFYNHPKTIADLVQHNTMKLLDHLHIPTEIEGRWDGMQAARRSVQNDNK